MLGIKAFSKYMFASASAIMLKSRARETGASSLRIMFTTES